jgi:hypothetical protein
VAFMVAKVTLFLIVEFFTLKLVLNRAEHGEVCNSFALVDGKMWSKMRRNDKLRHFGNIPVQIKSIKVAANKDHYFCKKVTLTSSSSPQLFSKMLGQFQFL